MKQFVVSELQLNALRLELPGTIVDDLMKYPLGEELWMKVERLSALEHDQWVHWTRYMLDNLTPDNIERWRREIDTPYDHLTDYEKESDREWANRAISLIMDGVKKE